MSKLRYLACACGMAVAVSTVQSAAAQDAAATAAAEADDPGGEIIVTARKRAERLQDVPAAITAIGADTLQKTATNSYSQLVDRVPSLTIQRADSPAGAVVNLRGIGASTASPSIDGAVSINIDGLQSSQGIFLGLGIYDLERVEVLKGPQALFYGKNSPGGVMSLVSASPGSTFEARVRTGYEFSHRQKFIEAMASGPLTDTVGARVVGYFSDQEGWFRNIDPNAQTRTSPHQQEYFVRGTLTYGDTSDSFRASLKLATGKVEGDNNTTAEEQIYACGVPGSQIDCKLDRYYVDADPTPGIRALNSTFAKAPFNNQTQTVANLTLNYSPADTVALTSITGLYKAHMIRSGNFSPRNGDSNLFSVSDTAVKQFSQEVRALTSFDGWLNFAAGFYYQHHKLRLKSPIAFGPPLYPSEVLFEDPDATQTTNARSAFGQAILRFSSKWEITAGARYSKEKKRQTYRELPSESTGYTTVVVNPLYDELSFDDVSAEVTVSYRPTRQTTIYAAYREGFTSGGFSLANFLADGADNTYRPETASGGEVGIKGSVLDGDLRYDLTGYYYKYRDLQLSSFDPDTLGFNIDNAGAASVKGVEFSLQYQPRALDGLSISTNLNYNRARYLSFRNAGCYGGQSIAAGCNGSPGPNGVFNSQDLSGRPLGRAPLWSGNVDVSYDFAVSNSLGFEVGAGANYKGSYVSDNEQDPRSVVRPTWRLDARAALHGPDDRWELALVAKNLTNVLRVNSGGNISFSGSGTGTDNAVLADEYGTVSDPRTMLLQATVRF